MSYAKLVQISDAFVVGPSCGFGPFLDALEVPQLVWWTVGDLIGRFLYLLVPWQSIATQQVIYIYMYILYTYNKVYRSIILYQVGLIMFGDLGGGQVVDALWMRCSA